MQPAAGRGNSFGAGDVALGPQARSTTLFQRDLGLVVVWSGRSFYAGAQPTLRSVPLALSVTLFRPLDHGF